MPDLAGFDFVLEIPRMGIEREMQNMPLAVAPGGTPDTLVPPFVMMPNVPLPGATGRARIVVRELTVQAVPKTALTRMDMRFDEGSLEAPGYSLAMMGGSMSVTVPSRFTAPEPAGGPGGLPVSRFALDFAAAQAVFDYDAATQAAVSQQVGVLMARIICQALEASLLAAFRSQGLVVTGVAVRVDSSRPSQDFMTLTAPPQVMWIDGETLGVFGYHRLVAAPGSPAWKTASDLPPAPYPGFPWYPVAALLSPESFQSMVACRASRAAATDFVVGPKRRQWINEEKAKNNNQGDPTAAEIAAADARVAAYLASPQGVADVAAATPPPCGSGKMSQTIPLDVVPDATGEVNLLKMELGQGRINITAGATAFTFAGTASVTLPMWIEPTLNKYTQQIETGPIHKGTPHTAVNLDDVYEFLAGVLLSFLVGPLLGSIGAVLMFALLESLAESLMGSILANQAIPFNGISQNAGADSRLRWDRLVVEPSGLMLLGTWEGGVSDPHKFEPTVRMDVQPRYEASGTILPDHGEFHDHCMVGEGVFTYTKLAWDTVIRARIYTQDIPLPLAYGSWTMWIGQNMIPLAPGVVTTSGEVTVPVVPNKDQAEFRQVIIVQVDGSDEEGWILRFRGEDANIRFALGTSLTDGSGRTYNMYTNALYTQGLTIEYSDEYKEFRGQCAEAVVGVGEKYELVQDVPFWETVIEPELYIRNRLRGAAHGRRLGATLALQEILINEPEIAAGMFQQDSL